MANAGTGLTLIKSFAYRDNPNEEWSNTYWFANTGPSDAAGWAQAFADLVNRELLIIPSSCHIIRGYGYNDRTYGSHAVYDYLPPAPIPGEFSDVTGGLLVAGDQAAMVEWKTNRKNTRGKWVYLRKYLHSGYISGNDQNALLPSYHTALEAYAAEIRILHGGLVAGPSKKDPQPPVDSIQSQRASPWITTRTLKRRGKRPRPG